MLRKFFVGVLLCFSVLVHLSITGCEEKAAAEAINKPEKVEYFKDKSTGLCFAKIVSETVYSHYVTSITCVPCDSIKNQLK